MLSFIFTFFLIVVISLVLTVMFIIYCVNVWADFIGHVFNPFSWFSKAG